MKTIISTVCMLALSLAMSISAFATDTSSTTDTTDINIKKPQVQQALADKKAEREDFRAVSQEKHALVKSQMEDIKQVMEENRSARKALSKSLKDITKSNVELDSAIVEQFKDYNSQIKTLNEELKATKGSIKAVFNGEIKPLAKEMDYEALVSAYDDIETILAKRKAIIAQITEIINSMSALIQ